MKRKITKRIILHHSASKPNTTLDQIRQWHKEKGFTDEAGHSGYHFFIGNDGALRNDRPEDEWGCHVKNANQDSIGIVLTGNFNWDVPTNQQIKTLTDLLIRLVKKYNLKYWNIYGHKDIKQFFIFNTTFTNCPGNNLYKLLPDIRKNIGKAIGQISWY